MVKPKKIATTPGTEDAATTRQRSQSVSEASSKKNGEVRLEITFSYTVPNKEVLPGIVLQVCNFVGSRV